MTRCPQCGSTAVERFTDHGLSCTACGHDGRTDEFKARDAAVEQFKQRLSKMMTDAATRINADRP